MILVVAVPVAPYWSSMGAPSSLVAEVGTFMDTWVASSLAGSERSRVSLSDWGANRDFTSTRDAIDPWLYNILSWREGRACTGWPSVL